MKINLIAIGESGVGKSTIGNHFLCEDWEHPFATSTASNSCTQTIKAFRKGGRSFWDTPGIPDTDRDNNREYYDMIINRLREKDFSAILFVFKYGRKDNDNIARSKVLLQEIANSGLPSVLVINDQGGRPGKPVEYLQAARALVAELEIDFSFVVAMNATTIGDKINEIVKGVEALSPQPARADPIKTIGELKVFIDQLVQDKELAKQQKIHDKKKRRKTLSAAKTLERVKKWGGGMTIFYTGIGLCVLGAIPVGVATMVGGFALTDDTKEKAIKEEQAKTDNEIKELENMDVMQDEEVLRLKNHYLQLRTYLG